MKKALLATTAAAALTLSGAAQAQEWELGLGGYWQEWVGFVDQDVDENDWDQQSDKEIHIKGTTTLDNGITFGVRAELEVGQSIGGNGAAHDEAVLTVSGDFGSLLLGNEDPAPNLLHVSAPAVGVGLQDSDIVEGDWVDDLDNEATTFTAIYLNDDANKVTYLTPNFSGFTAGFSLVPDVQNAQADTNVQDGDSAYALGANYSNEFDAAAVKLSAGYAWQDEDIDWISLGAQVGFQDFTVGGSYYINRNDDTDVDDQAWEIGGSFAQGPWAVSVGWYMSEQDATPEDWERESIQGSFSYALGPGVDWKSTIARAEFQDSAGAENEGWAAITGFNLSF